MGLWYNLDTIYFNIMQNVLSKIIFPLSEKISFWCKNYEYTKHCFFNCFKHDQAKFS